MWQLAWAISGGWQGCVHCLFIECLNYDWCWMQRGVWYSAEDAAATIKVGSTVTFMVKGWVPQQQASLNVIAATLSAMIWSFSACGHEHSVPRRLSEYMWRACLSAGSKVIFESNSHFSPNQVSLSQDSMIVLALWGGKLYASNFTFATGSKLRRMVFVQSLALWLNPGLAPAKQLL